jgi:hypothetical protein
MLEYVFRNVCINISRLPRRIKNYKKAYMAKESKFISRFEKTSVGKDSKFTVLHARCVSN